MSCAFHMKKQTILSQLHVPANEYTDASPKGSIDEEIRELINQINTMSGLVTTSSCSGRIAVFVDGLAKTDYATSNDQNTEPKEATASRDAGNRSSTSGSISIKSSGYWLLTSHKPLQSETYERPGSLFELIGFQRDAEPSFPLSSVHPRYIHFKFEPMILHILADTPRTAQAALNAATTAGLRESGISGLYDTKGRQTTPMVAIRGSSFRFDSIIGYLHESNGQQQVVPMVTESYLRTLVKVANERFQVNKERTARFRAAFVKYASSSMPGSRSKETPPGGFEPAKLRAERKRREGLARREALQSSTSDSFDLDSRAEDIDLNLPEIEDIG